MVVFLGLYLQRPINGESDHLDTSVGGKWEKIEMVFR